MDMNEKYDLKDNRKHDQPSHRSCTNCKGPIKIKAFGKDERWYNVISGTQCPSNGKFHVPTPYSVPIKES